LFDLIEWFELDAGEEKNGSGVVYCNNYTLILSTGFRSDVRFILQKETEVV
jgi:hypothetical protein